MDIVYAAENLSIAKLFSQRMRRNVKVDELLITENPDQTGSFYIGWEQDRYIMKPNGAIARDAIPLVK